MMLISNQRKFPNISINLTFRFSDIGLMFVLENRKGGLL